MAEHSTPPVVYIDANPFMYAIEGDEKVSRPIKDFFALLRQRPGIAITCELTLAEVLPKATIPDVRRNYFNLIVWSKIFDLRPVTREILIETADIAVPRLHCFRTNERKWFGSPMRFTSLLRFKVAAKKFFRWIQD